MNQGSESKDNIGNFGLSYKDKLREDQPILKKIKSVFKMWKSQSSKIHRELQRALISQNNTD